MNRPFDAKRYKRLLEGLEVTVLRFNDVAADNRVFRFDAQYFGKTALSAETQIERGKWEFLSNASTKVASFGAYALTNQFAYVDEGVPFLRCQNIRDGFVDFANVLHVNSAANELLAKSAVLPGTVLLTMSGSVGNAAVALPEWAYPVNSNQDVAKITPGRDIDPFYFSAFLNSRFGRIQTERLPVGSVQQHIFLWMIERLKIARFSDELESRIARAVSQAYDSERKARKRIAIAESTFIAALGMGDWQPSQPLSYTRSASQAFAAGRLDAEFFNPAIEAILGRLRASNATKLGSIAQVGTGFPWRSEKFLSSGEPGEPFVRIRDCKPGVLETDSLDRLESGYADAQNQQHAKKGDLVVGMDGLKWFYGSLLAGDCYVNQRVAHVRMTDAATVSPEYVLTLINSEAGQAQLLRNMTIAHTVGHITLNDVRGLLIPAVPKAAHKAITRSVQESHAAQRHARELLSAAQRAVEIAIERDETAALAHLASFGVTA